MDDDIMHGDVMGDDAMDDAATSPISNHDRNTGSYEPSL
jgi:hypothetical protein